MNVSRFLVSFLFSISTVTVWAQQLGANYNERLQDITLPLLAESKVAWVRGFINVPRLFLNVNDQGVITGVRSVAIKNHTPIDSLIKVKTLQANGQPVKIILSLKLDFKYKDMGVPQVGSQNMTYLLQAIETMLTEKDLGSKIDILVVGNEPMWETANEDADKLEAFLNLLIDQADAWRTAHSGWKYELFAGALNRVNELPNNPILKKVLKITKENSKIVGIDLHPHFKNISQVEEDLAYIRTNQGITKKIICTEYSPVRLWDEHRNDALGAWGTQQGYPSTMQVWEWLNSVMQKAAAGSPVSATHLMSYFNTQSWYPKNWFQTIHTAFCTYNVYASTYGFQRELETPAFQLAADSDMWVLNAVYNGALRGYDTRGFYEKNPLVQPDFQRIADDPNPCGLPTSTDPLQQSENLFRIFPNPATSMLTISAVRPAGTMQVRIFDYQGATVLTHTFSQRPFELPLALKNGCYLIEIRTPQERYLQKLLIQ